MPMFDDLTKEARREKFRVENPDHPTFLHSRLPTEHEGNEKWDRLLDEDRRVLRRARIRYEKPTDRCKERHCTARAFSSGRCSPHYQKFHYHKLRAKQREGDILLQWTGNESAKKNSTP